MQNRTVMLACFLGVCFIWCGIFDAGAEPGESMVPGQHVVISMPELGWTWDGKGGRVGIRLPTNYSPDKEYPALVYFGGGKGGDGPGIYGSFLKEDWVVICLPYLGRGWGVGMDECAPMLEKAHQMVPNMNRRMIVASGFSSGGGASSGIIQSKAGMEYFSAAIPAGLATMPKGFPQLRKKRGFPLLVVVGENDTQHDRRGWCERYCEHARSQGLDAELYLEKGVGHSIKGEAKKKIEQWLQDKLIQPYLDKHLASIEKALKAGKIEKGQAAIVAMQRQSFAHSPEVEEKLKAVRQVAYKVGEQDLERIKVNPSQPKLATYLKKWKGTPCYDKAMVVYNDLAKQEVQAVLALEPAQRERRLKSTVQKFGQCEACEPLMLEYNALASTAYDQLLAQLKGTQHKRLARFATQWPYAQAAESARAKRLGIAVVQLEAIQNAGNSKAKLKRFEREFKDLLDHESIRSLMQ